MTRIRTPPQVPRRALPDLPREIADYLEKLDAWTADLRATLTASLGSIDKGKQGRSLPIELPVLANADLSGTKFRYGGPPAIVAVLDAPDGPTLALRDGSAWNLLGSGGGSGPDLTAIEALTGTGIAVRTAANTWALRTLVAGAGISLTNANGAGGNPTIAAPTAPTIKVVEDDETSDSETPESITDLEFTVEAGKSYHFRFAIVYSEDGGGDITMSVAGPSASVFSAIQLTGTQLL